MLFVFGLCFMFVFLDKLYIIFEVLLDILEEIDLKFIFYIRDINDIFLSFINVFMLVDFDFIKNIFIIVYGFCLSGDRDWVKEMMLSFLDKVLYIFKFVLWLIVFIKRIVLYYDLYLLKYILLNNIFI